jgi:DNA-binding response OmpR family regulator
MAAPLILVVEDESKTAEALRLYLEHDGFVVRHVGDGRAALAAIAGEEPALVVLDLMLPQVDGLEVCRRVRLESRVPILMLSARTAEEDILAGLELGADDYVTKPFSPRTLVARVHAILRRAGPIDGVAERAITHGPLVLDRDRHKVTRSGIDCALTPREFRLLEVFMGAPGRAFTRDELVARAFGEEYEGFDRTVDVHVAHLRRKIEDDPATPRRVVTVFGVGYRYEGAS